MSLRVLLINAGGPSSVAMALRAAGYLVVDTVDDGDAAVATAGQYLPDVIVVNTEISSSGLIKRLAILDQRFPRPTLVLSKQENPQLIQAAAQAGVVTYTVMHVMPELLRSLVMATVANFRNQCRLETELAHVQQSLEENRAIDRARCLLMEQYQLSEREAYARLRRLAMDRRLRLVEAAQSLLNQALA